MSGVVFDKPLLYVNHFLTVIVGLAHLKQLSCLKNYLIQKMKYVSLREQISNKFNTFF